MKQYFKLIIFIIVVIITLPLFWLKLMQWAFLDETAIIAEGISLVGAILGGTISGALTLIGVKLTIDQQTKSFEKQEARYAVEKYNRAAYILGEVSQLVIDLRDAMESVAKNDFEENITSVYKAAEKLEEATNKMLPQASEISAISFLTLKGLSLDSSDIIEFINKEKEYQQEYVINEIKNGRLYKRFALSLTLFYSEFETRYMNNNI